MGFVHTMRAYRAPESRGCRQKEAFVLHSHLGESLMMCPTAVASRDSNFCSPGNASQSDPKINPSIISFLCGENTFIFMSVVDFWLLSFYVKSILTINVFLSRAGTQYQACTASGPSHLAGEPHLTREEWGRPALRSDPAGVIAGRRALPGRVPAEARQQDCGTHATQASQQHPLVRNPGCAPKRNFLHEGDKETRGEYSKSWRKQMATYKPRLVNPPCLPVRHY